MSTLPKLFFTIAFVMLALIPSIAADTSQDAAGIIVGNGNRQVVGNEINTHVDRQYVDEDVNAPTHITINNEAPVDTSVRVDSLDVGAVDESVLVFENEVISYPVFDNQTYYIRSGAPVAVYTIATGNDRMLLESEESKMTYDPVYHKFIHGIVPPMRIFPKYTEKCSMTASAPGYIVIDNRFSGVNTMVEISPSPF
jgi:hypothetical protein